MDALLQGLFLLFKGLLEGLFEWAVNQLFYTAGWLLLRLLTLGRHPRQPLRRLDPQNPRSSWVTAFGLLCLVGLPLAALTLHYG
jgi:hypothetical protein